MAAHRIEVPGHLRGHVDRLVDVIRRHGAMSVAFSGGVDSSLLAWMAHRVLGDNMTCVLGISPSLAGREERGAIDFLERYGIPFERVRTNEMDNGRYRANEGDRCFFCKDELFAQMTAASGTRFPKTAYGANADDALDHRPGARAAEEHGVVAPLAEAELTKPLVREISRAVGLEVWDKPAAPCLASRVPYFSEVNSDKLRQIEAAEDVLHRLGFAECRVRHYGPVARIEIPHQDHARLLGGAWSDAENGIRAVGFKVVVLEPDGLRSGRLNDDLPEA